LYKEAMTSTIPQRLFCLFAFIFSRAAPQQANTNGMPSLLLHSEAAAGGGIAILPPASPECWLTAIKAFDYLSNSNHHHRNNANSCSWMTPDHQKLLALELARCHLQDLGRPLFLQNNHMDGHFDSDEGKCTTENYSHHLAICLANLSDTGVHTYTHFFSYVNQLCTRLLQEVAVGHFQDTSHQLAKTSQLAQERLHSMVQQQEKLALLHTAFTHQVEEQAGLLTHHVRLVQEELQGQHEQWLFEQTTLQREQANELKRHQEELQRLAEAVASASASSTYAYATSMLKPWLLGFDLLLEQATRGYSFVTSVIYLVGTINVMWLLTLPRRLRAVRKYLYGIAIVETLLEVAFVVWMGMDATDASSFLLDWDLKQGELVALLRKMAFQAECLVYFGGLVVACLFRQRQRETPPVVKSRPSSLEETSLLWSRLESLQLILQQQQHQQQQQQAVYEWPPPSVATSDAHREEHAPNVVSPTGTAGWNAPVPIWHNPPPTATRSPFLTAPGMTTTWNYTPAAAAAGPWGSPHPYSNMQPVPHQLQPPPHKFGEPAPRYMPEYQQAWTSMFFPASQEAIDTPPQEQEYDATNDDESEQDMAVDDKSSPADGGAGESSSSSGMNNKRSAQDLRTGNGNTDEDLSEPCAKRARTSSMEHSIY
jgi:hypothetical protein